MIPLFDLHCDTLSQLYKTKQDIKDAKLNISLDKAVNFSPYIQVMAIWSDASLCDEDAYLEYLEVLRYARKQNIFFAKNASLLRQRSFFLAIEDARILSGDISRLDKLYSDGVRILTLNWRGESIIGGGWDTSLPLTPFGRSVVCKACSLGIITDISHSSEKASFEAIDICLKHNKIPIASHSNSFTVCGHNRNLSDELFSLLCKNGSIVGISLAPEHLDVEKKATINSILNHIYHYLSLGGENAVSLGCDFDGVSSLPLGIDSISDLKKLYNEIYDNFGRDIAMKLFFQNAFNFICKYI